jgi:hypothetical protein
MFETSSPTYFEGGFKDYPNFTDIPAYHELAFKELLSSQSFIILNEAKEYIDEIKKYCIQPISQPKT